MKFLKVKKDRAERVSPDRSDYKQLGKSLKDLVEIIHFTERVSTKIHNILNEGEIYRILKEEFLNSKYTVSILLLTDDGSKLEIVETSLTLEELKAAEGVAEDRAKGYKIDLNKSSIYRKVIREGKTVQANVSDVIAELLPQPAAYLISKTMGYERKSSILTPLKRHGKIIGALAISSTDLAEYFIPSVKNLALHISSALELADEYAERKKAKEEINGYQKKIGSLINSSTDLIFLKDKNFRYLVANKAHEKIFNIKVEDIIGKTDFDFMPKTVAEHCRKSDVEALKSGFVSREEFVDEKCFHVVKQRVVNGKGKVMGIAAVIRDITERKRMEEEIVHKSRYDELTGLYNRAFFEEEVKRLNIERYLPLSIIIGDVNGLKLVNDGFGHPRGDELLRKIAQAFKRACRKEDLIARWGGDEFIVFLPKTDEKAAMKVCTRIKGLCYESSKTAIPLSMALGMATKMKPTQNLQEVIMKAEDRMYTNKLLDEKSIRSAIIFSLEMTLTEKSHETREHTQRLEKLAMRMGHYLGLPDSEIDLLELLAALHDIGKVAIPNHILTKPGPLSLEEWKEMKKHSEIGYRIIKSFPELTQVAEAILAHHEWWNGKGYPRGLKGEKIPLISRIIAIIDAYDVMVHGKRPYKKRISSQKALEELQKKAGSQFDPKLVKIFVKMISEFST